MSLVRPSRRGLLQGAAATAALGSGGAVLARRGRPANLVLIICDQLCAWTLPAYGSPVGQTPHLDRLAAEGVRCDAHIISGFACGPARASLYTGLGVPQHGVWLNDVPLPKGTPTLGTRLSDAGYATAYLGKWHLSGSMYRGIEATSPKVGDWHRAVRPDPRKGFAFTKTPDQDTGEDGAKFGFAHWRSAWGDYRQWLRDQGHGDLLEQQPRLGIHMTWPTGRDEGEHRASALPAELNVDHFLADEAVAWLEQIAGGDQPFALVVNLLGPHVPLSPPEPWDRLIDPASVVLPASWQDPLTGKPAFQRWNSDARMAGRWTEDQFRGYLARYHSYTSFVDMQIGRILDALDRLGLVQGTVVAAGSDHGDMAASHGFIRKIRCGYEELMRVPLLVRQPKRLEPGSSYGGLFPATDVVPTLLGLMGVAGPAPSGSRSHADALRGKGPAVRDQAICEMYGSTVLRTARHKYVQHWFPRDLDELYDLETDPAELHNRVEDPAAAAVLTDLRQRLTAWRGQDGFAQGAVIEGLLDDPVAFLDLRLEVAELTVADGRQVTVTPRVRIEGALRPPRALQVEATLVQEACGAPKSGVAGHWTAGAEPAPETWPEEGTIDLAPLTFEVPGSCLAEPIELWLALRETDPAALPTRHRDNSLSRVKVGVLRADHAEGEASLHFRPVVAAD